MRAYDSRPIESVPTEPWRNGGGVTRTIATGADQWRVSIAEIEHDGPYSRFPGVSRISLVLRGAGLTLRDENAIVRLKPFEAIEYDGNAAWRASLINGPVSALNVMSVRGSCRAGVHAIADTIVVPPNCTAIVIALDAGCLFSDAVSGGLEPIEPGHLMVVSNVEHALQLTPMKGRSAPHEYMKLAVLVTIAPSAAR